MLKVMLSLISDHESERHEERDGPVDFSELRDLDGLLVLEAVLVYDAVAEAIGVYGIVVEHDANGVAPCKQLEGLHW